MFLWLPFTHTNIEYNCHTEVVWNAYRNNSVLTLCMLCRYSYVKWQRFPFQANSKYTNLLDDIQISTYMADTYIYILIVF